MGTSGLSAAELRTQLFKEMKLAGIKHESKRPVCTLLSLSFIPECHLARRAYLTSTTQPQRRSSQISWMFVTRKNLHAQSKLYFLSVCKLKHLTYPQIPEIERFCDGLYFFSSFFHVAQSGLVFRHSLPAPKKFSQI